MFTRIPSNKTVDVTYGVTIKCSAETTAGDKVAITWYKDGKVMSPSVRYYKDSVTGFLNILHVLVDDTGLYTCEASNEAGKIHATMYLNVKQKQIGKYIFEIHSLLYDCKELHNMAAMLVPNSMRVTLVILA